MAPDRDRKEPTRTRVRARASSRTTRSPRSSSPASCACSCRGSPGVWSPGPAARGVPTATADEVAKFLADGRGPRRPVDLAPGRRRARRRQGRRGRARRSARCSAGSSPRAPARSATTSARASAGWAGSRSGRSSSRRAARWCRCSASARRRSGASRSDQRLVLGALDARARRPRPARRRGRRRCPAASLALDPSVDARALTRSALTGMVDAICRDSARRIEVPAPPPRRAHRQRRRRGVPRPARRQRVRRAGARRAARSSARVERWARSVTGEHARADRAARPARRTATRGTSRCLAGRGGRRATLVPIEQRDRRRPARSARDLEDEIGAPRAACCPRCCGPGGTAPRPGDPEPGRGVGADGRSPARGSPRRLRRARARAVDAARPRRRCACSSTSRRSRRSAPTSSPTCAGRRCSTTSSSPRPTSRELAKEARPLIRSGGRWVAIDQADLRGRGRRARRAGRHRPSSRAPRCCASRSASRARRSPAASSSRVAAGRPTCSPPPPTSSAEPAARARRASSASCAATRPRRWRGSASSTPAGLGGCLALDMGLGKTPTMLAHLLAGAGARARARDRAARGRRQLDRGSGALHARPARGRAPRREPRRAPTRSPPRSPTPTSSSPPTAPRCATSTRIAEVDVGAASSSTRRRRSRTRPTTPSQQLRRIPARTRVALTGTPIENGLGDLWAILDFTNPGLVGPRPQFIARLSSDGDGDARRRPKTRCARSTASSCSAARRPSRRSRPSCPTRSTSSTTAR